MVLRNIFDILSIIVLLLPIVVQLFSYIGARTHNQKLVNLSERAKIIVAGLEQSGLQNKEKKQAAMQKLAEYASEVGIKATADQVDDYIESAVRFLKIIGGKENGETTETS